MASNHVAFVTAGGLTNATVAHSLYGYCTTAAGTVAKTVTMYKTGSTAGASWAAGDLVHGLTITVRFQYSNTAINPTLNVNSTGAKPIYKYGTTVPGTTVDTSWPAQAVVQLTYDTLLNTSGCWVMNDHIDNTDTTYESKTAASGGTDVSLVTTGEKYTWNNKASTASPEFSGTPTAPTAASGTNTTQIATTAFVTSAINGLPTPMQFIGTVGTDGTTTWANLATASSNNEGYTYKVITDHSAETGKPAAKIGDTIISNGSEWIVVPSGDEPSGTVTSITLKAGNGISLNVDNTAITSSGSRTISHANTSNQSSSSNSGRTYIQSVTLDDYGHVTGLSTATETVTNTDTKLQVAAVTSGTTYYPIVGTDTTAATRQYDTTGLVYVGTNGTANGTNGNSLLTLGNSTASTTANWKKGTVRLYGTTAYYTDIVSGAPTANRIITLPNATGTLALTTDIPDVSSFITDAGVTKITTTAGTHTAITNSTGAVSFNVPTKTSHLTNDSGFITSYTDEKLKQENSTAANTYRVLLSHSANDTTETSTSYKSTNLKFTPSTGNLQTIQLNGVTVGSSPKFTDTVTTVTASGSGNVVTGMTASNGAITYTMGTVSTTAAQIVRW